MKNRIFSTDSAKAVKAQGFGYLNAIQYLAPASLSGWNLCPHATESCVAACLGWFSGQAAMVSHELQLNSVRKSRIEKSKRFMTDRKAYMADVVKAAEKVIRDAHKAGLLPAIRLNGSSDIAWEGVAVIRDGVTYRNMMEAFPEAIFIDYTKSAARLRRKLPANYHLTLSYTGENEKECRDALAAGFCVAVVFGGAFPETFLGAPVIDGDAHDLRHMDPAGSIVGLKPKGAKAKKDQSGFVVRLAA